MKRRLLALVPFVLFGWLLNVGVAWACATWSPLASFPANRTCHFGSSPPQPARTLQPPEDLRDIIPVAWLTAHPLAFDGGLLAWDMDDWGWGIHVRSFHVLEVEPGLMKNGPDHVVHRVRCGWPMDSQECTVELARAPGAPLLAPVVQSWRWGVAAPAWLLPRPLNPAWYSGAVTPVPLKPVVPGMIVNSAAYAAMAWGLLFGPGWINRQTRALMADIRRRRFEPGLCPSCGYSLAGTPVGSRCPECGKE